LGGEERKTALPMMTERLVRKPTRRKAQARPRTQGMRKKPSMKVTDPQSIRATDAPRSMDATPAGVTCRGSARGPAPPSSSRDDRRMVSRSAQSSQSSRDWRASAVTGCLISPPGSAAAAAMLMERSAAGGWGPLESRFRVGKGERAGVEGSVGGCC
jgi:hypothetical protein